MLVLLLDNFILSVGIEWLKKLLHYNTFVSKTENRLRAVTLERENNG